jgi:hypothetical protein
MQETAKRGGVMRFRTAREMEGSTSELMFAEEDRTSLKFVGRREGRG